jgi:hypothetical protein
VEFRDQRWKVRGRGRSPDDIGIGSETASLVFMEAREE